MIYRDITQQQLVQIVTQAVQSALQVRAKTVPVGISVRHVHLTRRDVERLFGYGYQLTPKKALSQPGQFAAEECVDVIGPKGTLHHVRVLGPERSATQIELAQTDCRNIGIAAPVRASGHTQGTPGCVLRGPLGEITIPEGVIVADRRIDGEKPGVLGGVLIRSNDRCEMDFHIDTDDGNAFLLKQGQLVTIIEKGAQG